MSSLKLDPRDRLSVLLALLAVTLVLCGLMLIPAGPLRKYRESKAKVESLESSLKQVQLLRIDEMQRVESEKWIKEALEKRGGGFSLFTFLSEAVKQHGLDGRARLQNQNAPRGLENVEMINMNAQGVKLEELVNFLHAIYASNKLIVVYNMNFLGPMQDGKGLECRITFLTPKS